MPEYEAKVKFHIFPYRKFKISAKDEEEARELANDQAQHIIDTLDFSVTSIKAKRYLMDKFL
ncbi:MAG: hypothetical protein KGD61_04490 [Candidatus Lokiarchaeota archaeon]|nr:hypothetical protein [Candidatus Lokiarchaeota archaeon]